MNYIEILIEKTKIFEDLSLTSSYTGVKTPTERQAEFFDRVATIEEDAPLLNRYWHECNGELASLLRDFIMSADFGEEATFLKLMAGSAYDESLTPSLKNDIISFVANEMAAKWQEMTFPENAGKYAEAATRFITAAKSKLLHHKAPIRKYANNNNQS